MRRSTFFNRIGLAAAVLLAGLAGSRLSAVPPTFPHPQPNSPLIPTPYHTPAFHSGGTLGITPFPGVTPFYLNPLAWQLQGTPTGVTATSGIPTQIPSFLLGNYDPTRPPAPPGAYFPNHFADGIAPFQWTAPFAYVSQASSLVTLDDNALLGFTVTSNWVLEPPAAATTASPAAGTATNGEYRRLPPAKNGTATWVLKATVAGNFSVYFHIPDALADSTGAVEPRSTRVSYHLTSTGANPLNVVATVSQTEANASQFLAGPFQLAIGDTVTVRLNRDPAFTDPTLTAATIQTIDALNQSNTADYLIADSMTLQTTIGDVRCSPTAINVDAYPDVKGAVYWGIFVPSGSTGSSGSTVAVNAIPDTTTGPAGDGTPILRSGASDLNDTGGAYPVHQNDPYRRIRQLVYVGRQEPTFTNSVSLDDTGAAPTGSSFIASGFAAVSAPPAVGAINNEYLRAAPVSRTGAPNATATWKLKAPVTGGYYVSVHLPATTAPETRIGDAEYTVTPSGGTAQKVLISQITSAGSPNDVTLPTGAITLNKGDTLTITLDNTTAGATPANTYVVADQVTMTTTTGAGAIYCVDGFTGGVVWRFETANTLTGASAPVFSSPVVAKINVLVKPAVGTTAAVYANKLVVIVGDQNGLVYCLDAIGNGDGTSNAKVIDTTTGQPMTIPQPSYGATSAFDPTKPHVGTTPVYWIYRPDPYNPKNVTGTNIGKVKTLSDPNSDLPVPAAFGTASPTVFVDPTVSTTPAADGSLPSNATVYVGNTNGVLYALDALGVAIDGTSAATFASTGDRFNVSQDLRASLTDPVVPTCQPRWWFTLRGADPNSTANASAADIESAPALYVTPVTTAGTTVVTPTVYIGSAHEQESTSNIGRLYALDGINGPSGNGGKYDPTLQPDPKTAGYTGPGSTNYNIAQRATVNAADKAHWSFPDAYGTLTTNASKKPRPALGNVTGSPVVFNNIHETTLTHQTRIYFAANQGIEIPPGGTAAAARPDDTTNGRLWAVNLDGSVGTTTKSTTRVWSYPQANDPNDATQDTVAEPQLPMGAFLHATPAIGFVQFPANITYSGGLYTHTDASGLGDVASRDVPMLYIGTRGVNDSELYAIDVDGDISIAGTTVTDTRLIYRQFPREGGLIQSSPVLITNSTSTSGNGGAVFFTAGSTFYDYSATPQSNLSAEPYPLIRLNNEYIGFGPFSSPAVAAADVTDISGTFLGSGALNLNSFATNVTDWVYVGDSSTGLCKGITPNDTGDAAIPLLGNILPPDVNAITLVDLAAIIHSYIFDGSAQHPGTSADITQANPVGPTAPLPVFEWGQNAYLRFSNVVPPNPPTATLPFGDQTLFVRDKDAGAAGPNNPVTYYTNGGPITFRLSDAAGADGFGDTGTVPATVVTALPADGFILRTDSDTTQNLATDAGKRWLGAYTYAIGDGTARRNTPGARRRVIEATQTVQVLLFDGANFTPATPPTTVLRASATNSNVASIPIKDANGVITGYQSAFKQIAAVDQPTFGILNPLGVRGGAIPLPLTAPTTAALQFSDELGPFRGVLSPPSTSAGGDTFALQALANGDTIYANAAPPSTSGVGTDPTRPLIQTNDTAGVNLPQVTKVVVTATGLVPHNGSGDNLDETTAAAPPTGQMSGSTTTNGLSATNFGSTTQPFAFDLFDRSALALSGQALRVKIGPSPEFGGKDGLYWNDNTTTAGSFNTGGGSVVNPLPVGWETPPVSVRTGVNTSPDYPDISPGNIAATLHASTGSADLTSEGAVPDGATASGGAVQSRIVTASPLQFHVTVPRFQPANQQLYRAVSGGYSTTGEIAPSAIASSSDLVFPMGYVSTKRIYVPNQYGRYVDGCAYRDIRVYTGVPVDMSTNMVTPTADIGKVPSGFGIQTAGFSGLTDANGDTGFTPYNAAFLNNGAPLTFFQPLQIENTGNVNLLNVHLDQKQAFLTGPRPLPLSSDPLDPLISIPGYDLTGFTGPRNGVFGPNRTPEQAYLVRSSLDTDLVTAYGHNPSVNTALYPGATFHKALVTDSAPSTLTVPDVPHDYVQGASLNTSPDGKPTFALDQNNKDSAGNPLPYKALPFVSVAIPFGTPVGTYSGTLQLFEGIDTNSYARYAGTNYPIYPPLYGKAPGGQGTPTVDANKELIDSNKNATDIAQIVNNQSLVPLSTNGTVLKATVLEDRMTDSFTFGALPQIDAGPAIAAVTNANGGTTTPGHGTPDFAPAAFRDPTSGDLSVYWTSGRATPYNIYGVNATYLNGAFMPGAGDTGATTHHPPSWWTSIGGYNNDATTTSDATLKPPLVFQGAAATNSGLTITQDPADPKNVFAFSTNVTASPYANVLYSFAVAPNTGVLTVPQEVTTDKSQVKYGAHGLNTRGVFGNSVPSLWAFWTTSTRGRTAIYYNSTATANAQSGTTPWPATTGLLPVPAGLTSVADPAPLLMTVPAVGAGGVSSGAQPVMEVTFSGSAPDGSTDLYQSRYTPAVPPNAANGAAASQLVLASYPTMTETLTPPAVLGGWYQARDVAWSRTGALNLNVGGTNILYDTSNKPLFSRAVFDKASGLLVLTGVSFTGAAGGTVNVYVDLATGRVRFTVPPPSGAVLTATFNPLARRITNDPRADTAPTTFLDAALKANGAPTLGAVEADRRWYVWRKSGVSGDPHTTTLYEKTQRLTVYLPKPVDTTQTISVTVGGANYSGSMDVHNFAQSARLYFPVLAGSAALEGQTVTVSYTATDTKSVTTLPDTIQWQDEQRSNDSSAPPLNALAGLSTTLEYAIPLDQAVNENNVSAFLDPDAYKNTSGAATYPHKVWLFWNSTRNGTADLYYETIDPKF